MSLFLLQTTVFLLLTWKFQEEITLSLFFIFIPSRTVVLKILKNILVYIQTLIDAKNLNLKFFAHLRVKWKKYIL